jgi:hypothetical protein
VAETPRRQVVCVDRTGCWPARRLRSLGRALDNDEDGTGEDVLWVGGGEYEGAAGPKASITAAAHGSPVQMPKYIATTCLRRAVLGSACGIA